jgi:hypothetical protein
MLELGEDAEDAAVPLATAATAFPSEPPIHENFPEDSWQATDGSAASWE